MAAEIAVDVARPDRAPVRFNEAAANGRGNPGEAEADSTG